MIQGAFLRAFAFEKQRRLKAPREILLRDLHRGGEKRACGSAGSALSALYTEGETKWQKTR